MSRRDQQAMLHQEVEGLPKRLVLSHVECALFPGSSKMTSVPGQCYDLGPQVPCCRSARASIPHQGNLPLAEIAQYVLYSYSFPQQVSSFEECRTKCWVGHHVNCSQLIPLALQSLRFHGVNTMRIDYEEDRTSMKTCHCESFRHDPEATITATGKSICALEGPSSILQLFVFKSNSFRM